MDFEKFLIVLILFVLTAFFFPDFQDKVLAVSESEPLRPLIISLPTAFVGCLLLLLGYFGVRRE